MSQAAEWCVGYTEDEGDEYLSVPIAYTWLHSGNYATLGLYEVIACVEDYGSVRATFRKDGRFRMFCGYRENALKWAEGVEPPGVE